MDGYDDEDQDNNNSKYHKDWEALRDGDSDYGRILVNLPNNNRWVFWVGITFMLEF